MQIEPIHEFPNFINYTVRKIIISCFEIRWWKTILWKKDARTGQQFLVEIQLFVESLASKFRFISPART